LWQISIIILTPGKHEAIIAAAGIMPAAAAWSPFSPSPSGRRLFPRGTLLNASHPPTFRDPADQTLGHFQANVADLRPAFMSPNTSRFAPCNIHSYNSSRKLLQIR
jgi:hypothetical protein